MANGADHAIGAFLAVAGGHASVQLRETNQVTAAPLLSGTIASFLGSLPDLLEPAIHPHHRQFFHCVAFAGALAYGMCKVYEWRPEQSGDQLLRGFLLIAGGAYLTHLAMDACTPRSIPLLSLR